MHHGKSFLVHVEPIVGDSKLRDEDVEESNRNAPENIIRGDTAQGRRQETKQLYEKMKKGEEERGRVRKRK